MSHIAPSLISFFLLVFLKLSSSGPTTNSIEGHRHIYPSLIKSNEPKLPILVAHRGDKVLLPEHTIPAYDIAMLEKIDYVEPDLVLTSDGVLVCHHDLTLKSSTNVGSIVEFATKMTQNITLFLDGAFKIIEDDWLISNFTFEELKKLKVNQQDTGIRPQFFNGFFRIPSFQEYIEAVHKDTWRRSTRGNDTFVMGMIPELKHPNYHNQVFQHRGPNYMEKVFISVVNQTGYLDNDCHYNYTRISCSSMIVQCFHVDTIKHLASTTNLTLLTLIDTNNLRYLTYDGLAELKGITQYLGLWKELLFTGAEADLEYYGKEFNQTEIDALGGFIGPKEFVDYAHSLDMQVGIYTIYHSEEPSRRGCAIKCVKDTKEQELTYYFDLGVDAFFVEGICETMLIRERWYHNKLQHASGAAGITGVTRIAAFLIALSLTLSSMT